MGWEFWTFTAVICIIGALAIYGNWIRVPKTPNDYLSREKEKNK